MNTIDNYIESILIYVELSKKDELEIERELKNYLTEQIQEYKRLGFSEEESINRTVANFGDPKDIGPSLAQSLFPQRKWSLNGLLITSSIYIFSLYIISLIFNATVIPPWIYGATGVFLVFSTFLLVSKQLFISHFRMLFILFLIFHLILVLIGFLYFDYYQAFWIVSFFRIIAIIYILFIVVNLSIGMLYKPKQVFRKDNRGILKITTLIMNCISGGLVVGYWFLMFAGFWFFGIDNEVLHSIKSLIIPSLLLILWIITVFVNTFNKITLYISFIIQILLIFYILILFN